MRQGEEEEEIERGGKRTCGEWKRSTVWWRKRIRSVEGEREGGRSGKKDNSGTMKGGKRGGGKTVKWEEEAGKREKNKRGQRGNEGKIGKCIK